MRMRKLKEVKITFLIFPFSDVSFSKPLEKWKWLSLTNKQESPLDETQKIWTQPVYVKTGQDLISGRDGSCAKVLNAHQSKFRSQWLNNVPCKSLGLNLMISSFEFRLVCVSKPTSVLRKYATVVKF